MTDSDLIAAFRAKANYMKSWQPASTPSNRDRLELYALHKVAVSGDGTTSSSSGPPPSIPTNASAADRAKFQAWRSKSGISSEEAMRQYLQEADRQLRLYGSINDTTTNYSNGGSGSGGRNTPQTPHTTPNSTSNGNGENNGGTTDVPVPRGLAAIPLLCAAVAESRQAYLRRLAQTPPEAAWWNRQEPLCANPGSIGGLPETAILALARSLEHLSLSSTLVASYFWPVHNVLLGVWMVCILYLTAINTGWNIVMILVWGTRRTGISLHREWKDNLPLISQSITAMNERHQALTTRLVGLCVLPFSTIYTFIYNRITPMSSTVAATVWLLFMVTTWWYWFIIVPIAIVCMLSTALVSGSCFVLIEFAGV